MKHRIIIAFAAAFLGLVVVSSASAFECYNTNRSAKGNEAASRAAALASFEEILSDPEIVGLCPAGVEHVISGLEDAGYRTDVLINFHTVMAQGLVKAGHEDQLHDGQGIDHLSEQFFEDVDALIGEAFGICGGA